MAVAGARARLAGRARARVCGWGRCGGRSWGCPEIRLWVARVAAQWLCWGVCTAVTGAAGGRGRPGAGDSSAECVARFRRAGGGSERSALSRVKRAKPRGRGAA